MSHCAERIPRSCGCRSQRRPHGRPRRSPVSFEGSLLAAMARLASHSSLLPRGQVRLPLGIVERLQLAVVPRRINPNKADVISCEDPTKPISLHLGHMADQPVQGEPRGRHRPGLSLRVAEPLGRPSSSVVRWKSSQDSSMARSPRRKVELAPCRGSIKSSTTVASFRSHHHTVNVVPMTLCRPTRAARWISAWNATRLRHRGPNASPWSNPLPRGSGAVAPRCAIPREGGRPRRGNSPRGGACSRRPAGARRTLMVAHRRMLRVLECHKHVRV